MRNITFCLIILLIPALASAGGLERIDIAPGTMVNLAKGHSGSFMGGAVSGDLFFSRSLALRTTIGYTKDRYYPADQDYSNSDYGFWLSVAPYAQLAIGDRVKPYVTLLGTYGGGTTQNYSVQPIGMQQTPYSRLQTDARRNSSWSIGASLGTKVKLAGAMHVYGEVSHYFYSSVKRDEVYFGPDEYLFDRKFDFERNPTYMTVGLSYSLDLKHK